jgi:hypothetical protein
MGLVREQYSQKRYWTKILQRCGGQIEWQLQGRETAGEEDGRLRRKSAVIRRKSHSKRKNWGDKKGLRVGGEETDVVSESDKHGFRFFADRELCGEHLNELLQYFAIR